MAGLYSIHPATIQANNLITLTFTIFAVNGHRRLQSIHKLALTIIDGSNNLMRPQTCLFRSIQGDYQIFPVKTRP